MGTTYEEAAWGNNPFRVLYEAQRQINDMDSSESATWSARLSAHITVLNQVRGVPGKKDIGTNVLLLYWAFVADRLAAKLLRAKNTLDHDQLDVLATWFVAVAPIRFVFWRSVRTAKEVAKLGLRRATEHGLPHQQALSFMTYARAVFLDYQRTHDAAGRERILAAVKKATGLEQDIRGEGGQLALRQLVRVLKHAGELQWRLDDQEEGRRLLRRALGLAYGEANTASQAQAIEKLMVDLGCS